MRSACLDSAQEDKNCSECQGDEPDIEHTSAVPPGTTSPLPSFIVDYAPDRYEETLARHVASARRLLQPFLSAAVETEVHASPPTGYRQRLGLGIYDANFANTYRKSAETDAFEFEDGLAYVYWDSGNNGNMVPIKEFGIAAEPISNAMRFILPFVAPLPVLRRGLRCINFHTTLRGDQLTIAMIYGPQRMQTIDDDAWREAAVKLARHVEVHARIERVSVFGRERERLFCPLGVSITLWRRCPSQQATLSL